MLQTAPEFGLLLVSGHLVKLEGVLDLGISPDLRILKLLLEDDRPAMQKHFKLLLVKCELGPLIK